MLLNIYLLTYLPSYLPSCSINVASLLIKVSYSCFSATIFGKKLAQTQLDLNHVHMCIEVRF